MTDRFTWHGGGLRAAKAQFGDGPFPWLDLSTGINPNPWPIPPVLAIDWRHLPEDADLKALEAAAAAHFGCAPAHVCAMPGSEIGLRLLGDLLPGPAAYINPAYRTHAEIFRDARPIITLSETAHETLILANPNNPDGRLHPREVLLEHPRENWLIIDEAFADATPTESLAAVVGDDRNLIILRSFGKFFGLAGVRLGFLLGPQSITARLRQKLGAWPVSAAAIAIGRAAYADADWIIQTRNKLNHQAARLDTVLQQHGLNPTGASPLFRLIDSLDSSVLFRRFANAQILTRPFDYNPDWLRLGLPATGADLDRIARILANG